MLSKFSVHFIVAFSLTLVHSTYACDQEEQNLRKVSIIKPAQIPQEFIERYMPSTLPLSLFSELAKKGKTIYDGVTYETDNQNEIHKNLPYSLPRDYFLGLQIKNLTENLEYEFTETVKLLLKYGYQGRYQSGEYVFKFYAHIHPEDTKFIRQISLSKPQQATLSKEVFEIIESNEIDIHHKNEEELVATMNFEDQDYQDSTSLKEKISKTLKFVGPYILNDVLQSQATRVVPKEVLNVANILAAQAGYDTPVHASLNAPTEPHVENPLDKRREDLTRRSETIGAALAMIPGASKLRIFLNLACQYAGYDSVTHLYHGVPSKTAEIPAEQEPVQRKIAFAKGAARLAIVMFVPGGKFVVIGSKIYEFVRGESVTETIVNKVTDAKSS